MSLQASLQCFEACYTSRKQTLDLGVVLQRTHMHNLVL